jgi:hypothetical protein
MCCGSAEAPTLRYFANTLCGNVFQAEFNTRGFTTARFPVGVTVTVVAVGDVEPNGFPDYFVGISGAAPQLYTGGASGRTCPLRAVSHWACCVPLAACA